jgi:hypothetical protein
VTPVWWHEHILAIHAMKHALLGDSIQVVDFSSIAEWRDSQEVGTSV